MAQVIDGAIVVCRGHTGGNDCFVVDAVLNVWVEFASMEVRRDNAASAMMPAGWWITCMSLFTTMNEFVYVLCMSES